MPAPPPRTSLVESAAAALAAVVPTTRLAAEVQAHVCAYLETHGAAALTRDLPEHLTASTLVLDEALTHTLLCFHRKGGFWVQPGGHVDPTDDDLLAGALRELQEETGLSRVRPVAGGPADVDRHALSGAFGRCTWHLDVGYAVIADRSDDVVVSAESTDVAWFPLDALPPGAAGGLADRLARARAVAAARLGRGSPAADAAPS
ncbi:NUDIX hydrolase [Actinotalea sp. K2]|uniref:NUDIX hydrolase n=1 Tax=Actinotalea sp. K2 TaxID=2939438 RepID=UPI0020175FF2|nr:NUDIX domain-containing protein [Actinotalea sp. K2]MCL3861767.1 NUDIX domain-containing protein [Actinotalea sp. K2]